MARDGFQLVQEAVANWESLHGVRGVEVVEVWLGNTSERSFLAKVELDSGDLEYVQLTWVAPVERAEQLPGYDDLDEQWLGDQAAALFDVRMFIATPRVQWRAEGWE